MNGSAALIPSQMQSLDPGAWLAAIVANSDDAILSKTLDGVIRSWNPAAERLFGFSAEEAVGQSIHLIIPEDRRAEEDHILSQLRLGVPVDHFETVRRRKDGSPVEVSLTVSPVRDSAGRIVGASKIVRDISQVRRNAEQQSLMLREMHHRIKNLFAMVSGLIVASARGATSTDELSRDLLARVGALSRAHGLTLPDLSVSSGEAPETSLKTLLLALVEPHQTAGERFLVEGDDQQINPDALTMLALLLHELATNAAKYGALSDTNGHLAVRIGRKKDMLSIRWEETGVAPGAEQGPNGFGSTLEQAALRSLGASLDRLWTNDGVIVTLELPNSRFTVSPA